MRAAVVQRLGATPVLAEWADPAPQDRPAGVVAAALNPVDLAIVAGQMPFRQIEPPFVAGFEGVAQLPDGSYRYFSGPGPPYGSLAEAVPLSGAETAAVPSDLDPVTAAALGTSALAAWLALIDTGHLAAGDTVAVLGAEGQVGSVATQLARSLGAGVVVGVVRDDGRRAGVLERGADAAVTSADPDTLSERLRAVAPDGVDLILDLTWGPAVSATIEAARQGARLVQVGNAAGPLATISAPAFRNRQVRFLPHSNFLFSPADRVRAYEQLAARAVRGELTVDAEHYGLHAITSAWQQLSAGGTGRKLVITP